jgi:hypothetical protein
MAIIYVSSTCEDLREYRMKVIETLTMLSHKVLNMENYVAEDKLPVLKCMEDVGQCNMYVGIFGWKYGFVVKEDNPDRLSITEYEYRHAKKNNIPCLIFLLEESVACVPNRMDAFTGENESGVRIHKLRKSLMHQTLVSFFNSPDDLGRKVSVAVSLAIAKAWQGTVGKTETFSDTKRSPLGMSLTVDIMNSITSLIKETEDIDVLDINLHNGDYWWSSRLFLLAALVVDYTSIRCFAFLYNNAFIGLATPLSVIRALTVAFPKIAKAYYGTLPEDPFSGEDQQKVIGRVQQYSIALGRMPGGEGANKVIVDKRLLDKWLGKSFKTDCIEIDPLKKDPAQAKQILGTDFSFVALTCKKNLESIIDKNKFANNLAMTVLSL